MWPIFQIQRLVTAPSQLDRDSRACLHLYLANIYISSIIHISTHDLLVNLDISTFFNTTPSADGYLERAKKSTMPDNCVDCLVNVTRSALTAVACLN